jgi:hypothetical protein
MGEGGDIDGSVMEGTMMDESRTRKQGKRGWGNTFWVEGGGERGEREERGARSEERGARREERGERREERGERREERREERGERRKVIGTYPFVLQDLVEHVPHSLPPPPPTNPPRSHPTMPPPNQTKMRRNASLKVCLYPMSAISRMR